MRASHSLVQFFGLMATATVLASAAYASPALAGTMASTTESDGALAASAPVGTGSASGTGARSLADETRMVAYSNRTPRAPRASSTATGAAGGLVGPTSDPAASGSGTPDQQPAPVNAPAAPAKAAVPARTTQPARGTPLVAGGDSAGATPSATVPAASSTPTVPSHHPPAGSARRAPAATRLPVKQAPAPPPAPTNPSVTKPEATPPSTTPAVAAPRSATSAAATQSSVASPPATQLVATPPTATSPVATNPVATNPVATNPVATQSLQAHSVPSSAGSRTRRQHQLQTWVTRWPRAENDRAIRPVPVPGAPFLPAPRRSSPTLAGGPLGPGTASPDALADHAVLGSGSASVAVAPRRAESPTPPAVARPRADMPPPIPQVLSPAPPDQTRLPVGGGAAAGGGGVGSVAPSVVAEFAALGIALTTILLARWSLDRATWRSTLLAARLEHPG
jgi:hypothetical protein